MKIKLLQLLLLFSFAANAQSGTLKYRRSSLFTLMVAKENRKYEGVINKTFLNYGMSDKFNDHNLSAREIQVCAGDTAVGSEIKAYLTGNEIAKQLIAKWFNRNNKGCFDMQLVAQRGAYNASEMDATIARKTKRGLALLADAGTELIGNTFVLVSNFKFISKEELGKSINKGIESAKQIANQHKTTGSEGKTELADATEKIIHMAAKGYVIVTTSYLYRLNWNDSLASIFYNEMWMDNKSYTEKRKKAFDSTNIFSLKFIGSEVALADVQSTIYTTKKEEELVQMSTARAIDAAITKLQKKHEEFRVSTPLTGIDPLSAKIGMKEGLRKGDRYRVLEQVIDEDGRTSYEKAGVIKVDRSHIWDNRYMATGDSLKPIDCTYFTKVRGRKLYPGMLIRQKGKRNFLFFKI